MAKIRLSKLSKRKKIITGIFIFAILTVFLLQLGWKFLLISSLSDGLLDYDEKLFFLKGKVNEKELFWKFMRICEVEVYFKPKRDPQGGISIGIAKIMWNDTGLFIGNYLLFVGYHLVDFSEQSGFPQALKAGLAGIRLRVWSEKDEMKVEVRNCNQLEKIEIFELSEPRVFNEASRGIKIVASNELTSGHILYFLSIDYSLTIDSFSITPPKGSLAKITEIKDGEIKAKVKWTSELDWSFPFPSSLVFALRDGEPELLGLVTWINREDQTEFKITPLDGLISQINFNS